MFWALIGWPRGRRGVRTAAGPRASLFEGQPSIRPSYGDERSARGPAAPRALEDPPERWLYASSAGLLPRQSKNVLEVSGSPTQTLFVVSQSSPEYPPAGTRGSASAPIACARSGRRTGTRRGSQPRMTNGGGRRGHRSACASLGVARTAVRGTRRASKLGTGTRPVRSRRAVGGGHRTAA